MQSEFLRNIAIIAHVDHGKTTLVDEMLKQSGIYRENQTITERVMDSGDLERERGITILAKNTAVFYNDTKINLIDTPGHADFGGEVERTLSMVSGVLLLVDAFEGTMPQTRFVLRKALELGLKIIIVVNKVDRDGSQPETVANDVLELLLELGASNEQFESPIIYCSGRDGTASYSPDEMGDDLKPLFDTILSYIPSPGGDESEPFQMLISSVDYNEYVGRLAIGRIARGKISPGTDVLVCDYHNPGKATKERVVNLYEFEGLKRVDVSEASAGAVVCLSGIPNITIGSTICAMDKEEALPSPKISEPTIEMTFFVNDSPFAGREGKFVTSRHLRDRLYRETLKDVSLRVTDGETTESFQVAGRGEMHLSILIETMRREGYEFAVGTPKVLYKEEDGITLEPMEELLIDVPEECVGSVIDTLLARKGEMVEMMPQGARTRIKFIIPARGLLSYRSEFLTQTRGEGIFNTLFFGYAPYKGDINRRSAGSIVAFEAGESITYGLYNAQDRGVLFIGPGVKVYEGMVVGMNAKQEDISINVCKRKQLTNFRASGSDDALRLTTPRQMSLENCLEFLADDELLEVTPKNLRMRKRILKSTDRLRAASKGKA